MASFLSKIFERGSSALSKAKPALSHVASVAEKPGLATGVEKAGVGVTKSGPRAPVHDDFTMKSNLTETPKAGLHGNPEKTLLKESPFSKPLETATLPRFQPKLSNNRWASAWEREADDAKALKQEDAAKAAKKADKAAQAKADADALEAQTKADTDAALKAVTQKRAKETEDANKAQSAKKSKEDGEQAKREGEREASKAQSNMATIPTGLQTGRKAAAPSVALNQEIQAVRTAMSQNRGVGVSEAGRALQKGSLKAKMGDNFFTQGKKMEMTAKVKDKAGFAMEKSAAGLNKASDGMNVAGKALRASAAAAEAIPFVGPAIAAALTASAVALEASAKALQVSAKAMEASGEVMHKTAAISNKTGRELSRKSSTSLKEGGHSVEEARQALQGQTGTSKSNAFATSKTEGVLQGATMAPPPPTGGAGVNADVAPVVTSTTPPVPTATSESPAF